MPTSETSMRLFMTLRWWEGRVTAAGSRFVCYLWQKLDTDAPKEAKPSCYLLDQIDFWKPGHDEKFDEKVHHFPTQDGFGQPVLVYVKEREAWFELTSGQVVWNDGWWFRIYARKNTDCARFCNAGMPAWKKSRGWK